jgi:hypothetical protein
VVPEAVPVEIVALMVGALMAAAAGPETAEIMVVALGDITILAYLVMLYPGVQL